jgi:hypothetical protein
MSEIQMISIPMKEFKKMEAQIERLAGQLAVAKEALEKIRDREHATKFPIHGSVGCVCDAGMGDNNGYTCGFEIAEEALRLLGNDNKPGGY